LAKYAQQEEIHIQIEWVQLGNATAIREAMLARELDFGFMGIPPFLIGLDKGTNWQLIHGLSECPLGLVSFDPNVKSLEDFYQHRPHSRTPTRQHSAYPASNGCRKTIRPA
jgi:ABC-type nitrate/sulfonate/bicarbonate transport system substrate-binding protein